MILNHLENFRYDSKEWELKVNKPGQFTLHVSRSGTYLSKNVPAIKFQTTFESSLPLLTIVSSVRNPSSAMLSILQLISPKRRLEWDTGIKEYTEMSQLNNCKKIYPARLSRNLF